jgi:hypothetical protein
MLPREWAIPVARSTTLQVAAYSLFSIKRINWWQEKGQSMKIPGLLLFMPLVLLLSAGKFTGNLNHAAAAGGSGCYECHENYEAHPGEDAHQKADCYECHGKPAPNLTVEETHETIFKPEMERLHSPEFCFKCHKK